MNRQYCILVYSKNSPACQKLFKYIESLPFDLMNTTGITPCCADNRITRDILAKVGVEYVPTLMTKYFNNTQHQIQGDNIYNWIIEIANIMGYSENNNASLDQTTLSTITDHTDHTDHTERDEEPVIEEELRQKPKGIRGSLLTQALNMQKSRENEMSLKKVPPQ